MTDWQRLEEEDYKRACGNPHLVGCVLLVLVMALGCVVGWYGYHWIAACP